VVRLHCFFAPRRGWLAAALGLVLGLCIWQYAQMQVQEDMRGLLPDDDSAAARDFALLQRAPFLHKALIDLQAAPGQDPASLTRVSAALAAGLGPPFRRVVSGPADLADAALASPSGQIALLRLLPGLADIDDVHAIAAQLDPPSLRARLETLRQRMLGPEGWGQTLLAREDPLDFRSLLLRKLRFLNPVPRLAVHDGRFLSRDSRHALLIADVAAPITDFRAAADVQTAFEQAVRAHVPSGTTATLLSGHLYTLANARAIQDDLRLLLSLSGVAVAGLLFAALRPARALAVSLAPFLAMAVGGAAASLAYGPVSGVTLGFGAVLLGLAADYGIHVSVALQRHPDDAAGAVARLVRPLLASSLTTLAAFAVLLQANLPVLRQMAVFALAGLAAALLFSLLVLPHLATRQRSAPPRGAVWAARVLDGLGRLAARHRRPILALWLVLLVATALPAAGIRFSGDLRGLGVSTPALQEAEGLFRSVWGDLRGQALIFASGPDTDSALAAAEGVFAALGTATPGLASLSPLLPSAATQSANRARWKEFWSGRGPALRQNLSGVAAELGYADAAFAPFLAWLGQAGDPVDELDWRALGLGEVLDMLLPGGENDARERLVLTLAPDAPETFAALAAANLSPDVRPVSQTRFARELSEDLERSFVRSVGLVALVCLGLLFALYRTLRKTLAAQAPALTGLACLAAGLELFDIECTIYTMLATILIIGLAVDYGIFMVERSARAHDDGTPLAVALSGATTLAAFGVLALARHPALHGIGLAMLLGLAGAGAAALLVTPALLASTRQK